MKKKEKKYKWIIIREIGKIGAGKTFVFEVTNKAYLMSSLGYIKWNNRLRKYAFYPLESSYYEEVCLRDIAEFLEGLKKKIKSKLKGVRK